MNFIELIKRYDKQQAQKRRKALMKATRKLQGQFFKIFQQYYLKKHGEPFCKSAIRERNKDLIDKMLPTEIKASLQ